MENTMAEAESNLSNQPEKIEKKPIHKNKGGRPRKALKPKEVILEVEQSAKKSKRNLRGWVTEKAAEITLVSTPEEGETCVFKLGDSPMLSVRRGCKLVVPYDVISLLEDSKVKIPMTKWESGKPVGEYEVLHTRFPYIFHGEKTWDEYEAFLADQRKKPDTV
jgi:hypothetical protein